MNVAQKIGLKKEESVSKSLRRSQFGKLNLNRVDLNKKEKKKRETA